MNKFEKPLTCVKYAVTKHYHFSSLFSKKVNKLNHFGATEQVVGILTKKIDKKTVL